MEVYLCYGSIVNPQLKHVRPEPRESEILHSEHHGHRSDLAGIARTRSRDVELAGQRRENSIPILVNEEKHHPMLSYVSRVKQELGDKPQGRMCSGLCVGPNGVELPENIELAVGRDIGRVCDERELLFQGDPSGDGEKSVTDAVCGV
jgi:hypothetical protein